MDDDAPVTPHRPIPGCAAVPHDEPKLSRSPRWPVVAWSSLGRWEPAVIWSGQPHLLAAAGIDAADLGGSCIRGSGWRSRPTITCGSMQVRRGIAPLR